MSRPCVGRIAFRAMNAAEKRAYHKAHTTHHALTAEELRRCGVIARDMLDSIGATQADILEARRHGGKGEDRA